VVVASVVVVVAVAVAVAAAVAIVTDVKNQAILPVIVPNQIHAVVQTNKVVMMIN